MPYEEIGPNDAPVVTVEWLDIASDINEPGLVRRWTDGRLLDKEFISEGVTCVVLGNTWDENGWGDFSTFPVGVVLSIEKV